MLANYVLPRCLDITRNYCWWIVYLTSDQHRGEFYAFVSRTFTIVWPLTSDTAVSRLEVLPRVFITWRRSFEIDVWQFDGTFRPAAALPVGETDDISRAAEVARVLTQGIDNRIGVEATTQLSATVRGRMHHDNFLAGTASRMKILEVAILKQLLVHRRRRQFWRFRGRMMRWLRFAREIKRLFLSIYLSRTHI